MQESSSSPPNGQFSRKWPMVLSRNGRFSRKRPGREPIIGNGRKLMTPGSFDKKYIPEIGPGKLDVSDHFGWRTNVLGDMSSLRSVLLKWIGSHGKRPSGAKRSEAEWSGVRTDLRLAISPRTLYSLISNYYMFQHFCSFVRCNISDIISNLREKSFCNLANI